MTPRQIAAALTIAAVPVLGLAGIAHATPQDQPWGPGADGLVHLPDGLCYQPMSNPPAHVPCDSTRATTPYVPDVTYADDPAPHDPGDIVISGTPDHPLSNGLCVQPGSNPPFHVPCDSPVATTPYVPQPPAPPAPPAVPVAQPPKPIAVAIVLPDAVPMRWEFQHGA